MTAHSYSMDPNFAAKIGGTGRINSTGPYEGIFTRAEAIASDKGTTGIEFDVKTNEGATGQFIQVWTHNGQGERLAGANVIDALMLLLRVKDMTPRTVQIEKWTKAANGIEKVQAPCFVDLMNKQIGLLLQKEISEYQGKQKEKMLIYGAYDIASRKTPKEIVDKVASAKALDTIIASLKDKVAKQSNAGGYAQQSSSVPDHFDDLPNF